MSSPLKKFEKRCYESQHMHPREWGLLQLCLQITRGGKTTLFFDGRKMAARFAGVSKDTIYRSAAKLVSAGWLIPLNGIGKKRANGSEHYQATMYRVLSHAEWIKTEIGKGKCKPVSEEGLEASRELGTEPVALQGLGQSQNGHMPVPEVRHSFVIHSSIKTNLVKASSVGVGGDSSILNTGQTGVGEATQSSAASPLNANGVQTEPEQPVKIDWDAIQAKVEAEERARGL